MESTRSWLARILDADRGQLRYGMSRWLAADATLEGMAGRDANEIRSICNSVLDSLARWLERPDEAPRMRARADLRSDRAAGLAHSYLLEFLRQEGQPEEVPARTRRESAELLDRFFFRAEPRPGSDAGPAFAGTRK